MEATDEESDALLEKVRPNSASMTAKKILKEDLDLHYTNFFARSTADYILERLEKEVEYFTGELLKIQVYGKWHSIPRKQVRFVKNLRM